MTDPRRAPVPTDVERRSSSVELLIAWLWVGIPAAWGIWHVFLTSLKLFQ
jgi:hypothetical protein